jgi:hypothetical protein
VVGDDERGLEHGLEVGLVPAGEGSAGVGRLELGGGDHLLDAVDVGEGGSVEAPQAVGEHAGELDLEGSDAGRSGDGQPEHRPLHRLVVVDRGGDLSAAGVEHCPVDLELGGVEDDLLDRLGDLDIDALVAGERERFEIGLQTEPVPGGHDGAGEAMGVGHSNLARSTDGRSRW